MSWFSSFLNNLGVIVSGATIATGVVLLAKSAFSTSEGFKSIKQIALISILPALSVGVGVLIAESAVKSHLTDFFIVIRHLLLQWDFFLNIPLMFTLISFAFSLLALYWGYKLYAYFVDFFNKN